MTMLTTRVKLAVKQTLFPVAFQFPPIVLAPERLRLWLNALSASTGVDGDVVEIGCAFGGTAAYSSSFLERTGDHRRYLAYDTFEGFVADQFDADERQGTDAGEREVFSANSLSLARRVAHRHGTSALRLVKGDICDTSVEFPPAVSACLVDVDLEEPVYVALTRAWERLADGGVILVDDCDGADSEWRADEGYRRFVEEHQLPHRRRDGMGLVGEPEVLDRIIGQSTPYR